MYRLKSRVKGIPHGLRFHMPEINWSSVSAVGKHPSWEVLVNAIISARNANPHYRDKHKWSVDVETVANEVDAYNTKICMDNGWRNFVAVPGGGAPPPLPPSPAQSDGRQLSAAVSGTRKLWSGLKTLNDFLDSGEPPVAIELSEARASICVACPKNGQGDFSAWFTKPAANAITRQLSRLHERNLSTSQDAKLNVCEVCLCPMKLKVQTPVHFIKPHLTAEMARDLAAANPNCWVVKECA